MNVDMIMKDIKEQAEKVREGVETNRRQYHFKPLCTHFMKPVPSKVLYKLERHDGARTLDVGRTSPEWDQFNRKPST